MVDPTDISSDLTTLQSRLTGTFDPARTQAESGLAAYSTVGIQLDGSMCLWKRLTDALTDVHTQCNNLH